MHHADNTVSLLTAVTAGSEHYSWVMLDRWSGYNADRYDPWCSSDPLPLKDFYYFKSISTLLLHLTGHGRDRGAAKILRRIFEPMMFQLHNQCRYLRDNRHMFVTYTLHINFWKMEIFCVAYFTCRQSADAKHQGALLGEVNQSDGGLFGYHCCYLKKKKKRKENVTHFTGRPQINQPVT